MNFGIVTAASSDVAENYLEEAKKISEVLVELDGNLVYGGSSTSMMGECYKVFKDNGKRIYAYTTEPWKSELDKLKEAECFLCETTFDVKKNIFNNSDVIVVLPGGVGTISELLSFIEEKRSNNRNTPIELYSANDFYSPIIKMLQNLIINNLVSIDIFDSFKISHNIDEFKEHISSYEKSKERLR